VTDVVEGRRLGEEDQRLLNNFSWNRFLPSGNRLSTSRYVLLGSDVLVEGVGVALAYMTLLPFTMMEQGTACDGTGALPQPFRFISYLNQ